MQAVRPALFVSGLQRAARVGEFPHEESSMKTVFKISKLLLLILVLCVFAAPAPAAAGWWPGSWFQAEDPKVTAVNEIQTVAKHGIDLLQADQCEAFVDKCLDPLKAEGEEPVCSPRAMRQVFKHSRTIIADMRRAATNTLMVSEDCTIATMYSVEDGFFTNFVKREGKWYVAEARSNLVLESAKPMPVPAEIRLPRPTPLPPAIQETAESEQPLVPATVVRYVRVKGSPSWLD